MNSNTQVNNKLCPVLFVANKSFYKTDTRFDSFDIKRDALNYHGHLPFIAHPPCRLFSRLRGLSTAPSSEKRFAYWVVKKVRSLGGVVEHPYDSLLFKELRFEKPLVVDKYGGFTLVLDQFDFGFYTRKRTRLYIVGIKPSQLPVQPLRFELSNRKFSNLTKTQKSQTMPLFADFLHAIWLQIIINHGEKEVL